MHRTSAPVRDLARRAVRGSMWVAGAAYSGFILTFASTAIIARLVPPRDFGAYALAQAYSQILLAFGAFGFTQSVIQSSNHDARLANTALRMTIGVRLILACVAVPAAFMIRRYQGADVSLVFFQLSLVQIADAIRIGLTITLERDLDYARIARVSVTATVASTVLSIGAAYAGFGVYALVFRDASLAIVLLIGAWIIAKRASLPMGGSFDRAAAKEVWKFGRSVYIVRALDQVCARIDRVLLGNVMSLDLLGLYHQAKYVAALPTSALAPGNLQVAINAYSKIKDDRPRLSRAFSTVQYFVLRLVPPFAMVCALWPRELLAVVCGLRWVAGAGALRILAVFALTFAVTEGYRSLFSAVEQWSVLRRSALLQAGVMIALVPVLATRYGAEGAAVATLLASAAGLVFLQIQSRRYVGSYGTNGLRGAAAIVCALIGALACKYTVVLATPGQSLAFGMAASILLYAAMVWIWERKEARDRFRSVLASAFSRA
jgi:O-antigen/teichoic acid export membrane protein